MAGNNHDLRTLPVWLQYVIALTVVAVVVAVAWVVGRDDPVPGWITDDLIPILGWTYLALVVVVIVTRLARRK